MPVPRKLRLTGLGLVLIGVLVGLLVGGGVQSIGRLLAEREFRQQERLAEAGAQLPPRRHVAEPRSEPKRPFDAPAEMSEWRQSSPPHEVPRPRAAILIVVDTLRRDHLSLYGYERATTPHLDALLRESVVFENAHANAPWTLPSVASLMTSTPPPRHGAEEENLRLDPDLPTLAGAFAAQDWLSAAFVTHIFVSSLYGLDEGFVEFRETSINWNRERNVQLTAREVNNYVQPWLDRHAEAPSFLYVHVFDPHWDYVPPEPFSARYTDPDYDGAPSGTYEYIRPFQTPAMQMSRAELRNSIGLYDGEIAFTDAELGRLFRHLRELGIWNDLLLIVTADHGEGFEEHGWMGHTRTLYEELLRVPLIVKLPGGRPEGWRARVDETVPLIDLAPTILELAGLRIPDTFMGQSLVPLMRAPGPARPVVARTLRIFQRVALIDAGWKLIHDLGAPPPRDELYRLAEDPGETESLTSREPERARRLRERLLASVAAMEADAGARPAERPQVELTPEQRKHLEALGYL